MNRTFTVHFQFHYACSLFCAKVLQSSLQSSANPEPIVYLNICTHIRTSVDECVSIKERFVPANMWLWPNPVEQN